MIEVINERRNDINRRIICKKCESTIQFTYDDLKERKIECYGALLYGVKFLTCPVCDNEIIVISTDWDNQLGFYRDTDRSFGLNNVEIPIK